jgi:hypothetical protein
VAVLIALDFVMIDPKLRLMLFEQIGDALQRCKRLFFVDIHRGHPPVVPIVLEMHGVTTQDDPSHLWQLHQQYLMTRRVARSR